MSLNPVISIIIPHKNTPDLLKRCLASIPKTTEVQIIVVDDNSNENIVDFNMITDLKTENVEIYLTKEGKGAGYARNVGMKYATGKWIVFADSDDYFTDNIFELLFTYKDSPEEIIYFKFVSVYSDTNEPSNWLKKLNDMIDDYFEGKKYSEDRLRYLWSTPWAKMIKREMIERNNIRFDEITVANDIIFSCLAGHYASTIKVVNKVIYVVTINSGSLTRIRNFNVYKTRISVFLKRNKFLGKIGKRHIKQSLIMYFIKTIINNERKKRNKYNKKNYVGKK